MSTRNIAISRTIAALAALAALALVTAACGSDTASTANPTTPTSAAPGPIPPSSTPPSSQPATTATSSSTTVAPPTPAATTEAPTTSLPEVTTTVAPTATTEPPLTAAGLTLASNGVLPFVFGDDDGYVIDGLTAVLGAPVFDGAQTYPAVEGDYFLDSTGEEGYALPIGRTVCFPNNLCAQFGGATVDTLAFTGWDIADGIAPQLSTVEGITIGSVMSDFVGVVALDGGGCYTVGYGDASGVELMMQSTGEPFGTFDGDGNYVIGNPSPADVFVLSLSAGDRPYFLFDDC